MRVLIFGNGRLGASFAAYALHLGHDATVATRAQPDAEVSALLRSADLVAAALPDSAIAGWFDKWRPEIGGRPAIHFSGALTIDGMRSYHPLYSFPTTPLAPEIMSRIAIAREDGAPAFATLLPGAANPEFVVRAQDRPYYHALAVLTGNFAAHIWNEAARGFAGRFALSPEEILGSYLEGVVERFRESPLQSMTGPLARRDALTVRANLAALDGDPRLKALYEAFLESAWPGWPESGETA